MTALVAAPSRRLPRRRNIRGWVRENLFSGPWNTVLTIVSVAAIGFVLYSVARFVFVSADWSVVEANRRLFFLGRFPRDETWRVWTILFVASALAGASVGAWTWMRWWMWGALAALLLAVFLFIQGGTVMLLTALTAATFVGAYLLLRAPTARPRVPAARTALSLAWVAGVIFALVLLNAVDSLLWGGLLLTMMLTVVGIAVAFPFGVLLAVGRTSSLPVVRWFCIGYIETVRGVPLISILFMATFILPLVLRPERDLSLGLFSVPLTGYDPNLVVRALVAIIMFSAAYLAETVRGGLQSVPRGQIEAAQALGLGQTRILAFIVLPQALRAVIPAIVGQFISLFKDTSLVAIVGLTDLLGVAEQVTAQRAFIGRHAETLLFVSMIYWVVAFSMSRASQRLERNLGLGER